jgi:cytochrome o ubiquinol oxidase subunit 2
MATQLHLQADRPGVYHGQSAMFSGDGFPDMHFPVRALPPADRAAWVENVRGQAAPLDLRAYARLAQPGVAAPQLFGAVQPRLFDAIVSQHVPPAPRPMPGRSGGDPAISPKPEASHVR